MTRVATPRLTDLLLDHVDLLAAGRPPRSRSAEAFRAAAACLCDASDYARAEDRRGFSDHPLQVDLHRRARALALREMLSRELAELAELEGSHSAAEAAFRVADQLAAGRWR